MSRLRPPAVPLAGMLVAALFGCPAASSASTPAAAPGAERTGPLPAGAHGAPPRVAPGAAAATLTIPSIGIRDLRVVPYAGTTDDWPGTRVQNHGLAATPYGPRGGVGPGEVGNYLVTAHRTADGGPFHDVPAVQAGALVLVSTGGTTYAYVITGTRQTDFRSARSLAGQRAAVPGHPGEKPTEAMITISTCATPEDAAAGITWRDDKGNPEHRIDKIGVLTGWSTPGRTAGPGT